MSSPLRWRMISGLFLMAGLVLGALANAQKEEPPPLLLEQANKLELVDGDLKGAIATYERILNVQGVPRVVAARALLHLGECHEKLGHAEARKAYERLVRDFGDQEEEVGRARARLAALGERDTAMRVRQVWAGPDDDLLGAPTRDGRYLTLQDWDSEDLAVRDLATGQKRRLTHKDPGFEFALMSLPSPDGQEVAYGWHNKDQFYDLRIVGMDGSNPRVLYASGQMKWVEPTDWSPDGKSILAVLQGRDKKNQIAQIAVKDGSARVLKAFDEQAPQRPRFSPDGRFVAYGLPQGPRAEGHDIFLLAVDGSREVPLVQNPANDVMFDWTPDGKRILFGSDRSGTTGAWWIPITDGQPRGTPELVRPDLGQDVRPMGFTQDGSYYYWVRTAMSEVYIAELDLASGRRLAEPSPATERYAGSNHSPEWSSDGRQLLFLSHRGPGVWGARAICVRDMESGEVREIPSKLERMVDPRWSPDGQSLFVIAQHPAGEFGPFRINLRTGDFERVDLKNPVGWGFAWSPDGKAFFYHRGGNRTKTISIVTRDLATGREKELFTVAEPSNYRAGVALSRDGRQLAFAVRDAESQSNVLKVLPAEGGEARDVLRGVEMPFPGSVAWTPDGLNLVFTGKPSPRGSKTELWRVPVQGGAPQKLDLAADDIRELCLHPDGRHIAFTAGKDRQEVWALSNFLPAAEATVAR
jgi:Tol biopolymer transport system component